MTEYERGQKDLAEEIYNLIVYDKASEIIRFSPYTPPREIAHCFDNILMNIFKIVKEKKNEH